ncbi:hypothetical protein [Lacinutrix cladophorae]
MRNLFIHILLLTSIIGYCQETNLNVRVIFHPGIEQSEAENIDIIINILVDSQKISEANILSNASSIIQSIPNPNNQEIFFEVNILSPDGWAVVENPIKYNTFNRTIKLRKLNDAYFKLKQKAEKSKEANSDSIALETYDYILDNNLYSTENQKFETVRSKADLQFQMKSYKDAIKDYIEISNEIDLTEIGNKRKAAYINGFFNSILKAGNYNNLNSPKDDFPDIIKQNSEIDIKTWTIFSQTFDKIYPNTIELNNDTLLLATDNTINNQFNLIGKKLKAFKL